ncbi:MAG: DUF1998 domain-containing protein [Planctomycetes bacterium]|nr:DUF1998 domain-containing protein [Planctomycetota bacterium]
MNVERSVRRSQCVAPFGVGAILDLGDESLVATDITRWGEAGVKIRLPRLERMLGVGHFRMAPALRFWWSTQGPKLPFFRFPQWLFCPSCRKMTRWRTYQERDLAGHAPRCSRDSCKGRTLVPMRFVLACENGHLGDVDWKWYVHAGKQKAESGRCEREELYFRTRPGRGGGLASLVVHCITCDSRESLHGITAKDSMKAIGVRCSGKQPWQRGNEHSCDCVPQVLQRGASNLYYPATVSALDIPTGTEFSESAGIHEEIRNHQNFNLLVENIQSESGDVPESLSEMVAKMISESLGCPVEDVWKAAGRDPAGGEREGNAPGSGERDTQILREEWQTLTDPPRDPGPDDVFAARISEDPEGLIPSELSDLLEPVVLVERLREVRTLRGFHRVTPGDDDRIVRTDLGSGRNWLPAHEVFGEGVFIRLKEQRVKTWISNQADRLSERLAVMALHRAESHLRAVLPEPTPRFVLLHTLSHLLIRQLSFECGYTASSLRERIYSTEPENPGGAMAGILIYTADSDSEGSLGGLVRQGQPDRLPATLTAALNRATWCSADPICSEAPGQGLFGMNLAACHACSLLSETSCVYSNVLLDRTMTIGGRGLSGFFSGLLAVATGGKDQ